MRNNNSSIFSKKISQLSLLQKTFLILSLALFILSLFFHAYKLEDGLNYNDSKGINLFLFGWMGIMIGYMVSFIWAANPLYFIALYYFIKGSSFSLMFSIPAMMMALLFLRIDKIIINENGKCARIDSLDAGYYFWIAAFIILVTGSILEIIFPKKLLEK